MKSRNDNVRAFFDNTQVYLKNDFQIFLRASLVRELLGEVEHLRILDLGCGDGSISLQFLSETTRITLIDLSNRMLDMARKKTPERFTGNVEFINSDLRDYTTKKKFDVVLCLGVLAHVPSIQDTLVKVAELTKPGGHCIFQITDNNHIIGKILNAFYLLRNSHHGYSLNKTKFKQIAMLSTDQGLNLIRKRQYLSLLPGMGMLPHKWLFEYQQYSMNHDARSKYGSEMILLFQKETYSGETRHITSGLKPSNQSSVSANA